MECSPFSLLLPSQKLVRHRISQPVACISSLSARISVTPSPRARTWPMHKPTIAILHTAHPCKLFIIRDSKRFILGLWHAQVRRSYGAASPSPPTKRNNNGTLEYVIARWSRNCCYKCVKRARMYSGCITV